MKKHKKRYDSLPSFVDLLLNVMMGILLLYFLTFPYVNPMVNKKEGALLKAEYLITIEWSEDADVDLYARDPNRAIVYYNQKAIGLMHLDYDNRGTLFNSQVLEDGTIVTASSYQEALTIRGIVPGEYTINVHLYARRDPSHSNYSVMDKEIPPVPVKLIVQRLNPTASVVYQNTIVLTKVFQEKAGITFTLDAKGNPTNFNTDYKAIQGQ